jgi:myo-inositol-1(or 4)-monophosphatase
MLELKVAQPPREPADELDELLDVAREAARSGAGRALEWSTRRRQLKVEEKAAPGDYVSDADRASEEAIRQVLSRRRPGDGVLGEEGGETHGKSGVIWAVDPIDGTTEYLYGGSGWAVSVAAVRAGDHRVLAGAVIEPTVGRLTEGRLGGGTWCDGERLRGRPQTDLRRAVVEINLGRGQQRAHAGALLDSLVPRIRDIRDRGSAACALSALAGGRVDAYWGPGLQMWDAAAGLLLAAEAGALTGDLNGSAPGHWPSSGDCLAANAELFDQLRVLLGRAYR